MPLEHGGHTLLQLIRCRFRAKTKIELHNTLARNHVTDSCACMDVAHLPTGRLEERIALVPFDRDEFSQRGSEHMNRILSQLRVGDVSLHSFDDKFSAHRTAAAVFDHISCSLDPSRFPDDAPVEAGVA